MKEWWDRLLKTWPIILAVLGVISAAAILPYRLEAVEKNDAKQDAALEEQRKMSAALYEQTTAINSLIQQKEQRERMEAQHEAEMKAAAPPGMVWDSATRKYVSERAP